jgi:hypothetical protein
MIDKEETADRTLPSRLLHKLYRITFEVPRRARFASSVYFLPPSGRPDPDASYSVHMHVRHGAVMKGVCTAKAANLACETPLPWVFHDDGTLSDEDEHAFDANLPGSVVVRSDAADERRWNALRPWAALRELVDGDPTYRRLLDLLLWRVGDRVAYVDPHVLFFQRPEFLLEALEGACSGSYIACRRDAPGAKDAGLEQSTAAAFPKPFGGAGLWVVDAQRFDPAKADQILNGQMGWRNGRLSEDGEIGVGQGAEWLIGLPPDMIEPFPSEYDTSASATVASVIKYYTGSARGDYEMEGLRHLLHELEFERRWHRFTAALDAEVVA